MIELFDGNLEVIGARIQLSNVTVVPAIVHVQGGNLTLTRCWLQGPLTKSVDAFTAVITVHNNNVLRPTRLSLQNNIVLSGKLLIHLQDQAELRARNNVFLSLGDGMHYEGTGPTASLLHVLDHNTWAVRQRTFTMHTAPEFQPAAPVVHHANCNAFINPFADEAAKAVLLCGAEAVVSNGGWIWQGRANVYDERLHAFFGGLENSDGPKQTVKDWQMAWGTIGERDRFVFENGPAKTIPLEGVLSEMILKHLDRLALPGQCAIPRKPPSR